MNKTVESVERGKDWTSSHGKDMASLYVRFTDGEVGQLNCHRSNVDDRMRRLEDLIGQPGEFDLIDQGTFGDGNAKPYKIAHYPGEPESSGFSVNQTQVFEAIAKLDERMQAVEHLLERVLEGGTVGGSVGERPSPAHPSWETKVTQYGSEAKLLIALKKAVGHPVNRADVTEDMLELV